MPEDPVSSPWRSPRSTSRSGTSRPACSANRSSACSARCAKRSPSTAVAASPPSPNVSSRSSSPGGTDEGIGSVKMKVGTDWGSQPERDLARVAAARDAIGTATELFVDANGAYTRKQAIRLAHMFAELGVTWFEEPVSADDLDGLREIRGWSTCDVAAGEYGYDLAYFARMCGADAVDVVQADVSRCGGITEWQRAAALAAGHGLDISGHCAPEPPCPHRLRRAQRSAPRVLRRPRTRRPSAARRCPGPRRWTAVSGPKPARTRTSGVRRGRALPPRMTCYERLANALAVTRMSCGARDVVSSRTTSVLRFELSSLGRTTAGGDHSRVCAPRHERRPLTHGSVISTASGVRHRAPSRRCRSRLRRCPSASSIRQRQSDTTFVDEQRPVDTLWNASARPSCNAERAAS